MSKLIQKDMDFTTIGEDFYNGFRDQKFTKSVLHKERVIFSNSYTSRAAWMSFSTVFSGLFIKFLESPDFGHNSPFKLTFCGQGVQTQPIISSRFHSKLVSLSP